MHRLLFLLSLLLLCAGNVFAQDISQEADSTVSQEPESLIDIPNILTPDSHSGENRIFKVKHRSLKTFEMWVFNRSGNQLFHTTDPLDGWDGTSNGKIVPSGAYYYVVKAEGTDGRKYNKKGAINVLRSR